MDVCVVPVRKQKRNKYQWKAIHINYNSNKIRAGTRKYLNIDEDIRVNCRRREMQEKYLTI